MRSLGSIHRGPRTPSPYRGPVSRGHPLVIGHRGASGYRPEHTEAAYRLAFDLGADAVEPDLVATRDGVLVLRHENEISGTTDVASRPEFADRRSTKRIDGTRLTGWFTEDFTWEELSTLRAVERLPRLRPASAGFDGRFPILRLRDLLRILDEIAENRDDPPVLVAEIKHATYSASIGLPLDELFAAEIAGWATPDTLITEAFEESVLHRIRDRGVPGRIVYLLERDGAAADLVATLGSAAPGYPAQLDGAELARLARDVDGVSLDRGLVVRTDGGVVASTGRVERARSTGLDVFTWTLRPENRFLEPPFRLGRHPGAHGDWRSDFAALLATGVDGVFTDHPDLAVEARAALSP